MRCRGLVDRHERGHRQARQEEQQEDGEEIPTVSFDFCFLCQKDQIKWTPTMMTREHRTCYTNSFTCSGKSTKGEEYSDQIVRRCNMLAESLGYKRVAMKSDQEESMRALQQRFQKVQNCEMVLTNSKKYDLKANGKVEKAMQRNLWTSEDVEAAPRESHRQGCASRPSACDSIGRLNKHRRPPTGSASSGMSRRRENSSGQARDQDDGGVW